MIHLIVRVLITAAAVVLSAKVVPGLRVKSFGSAIIFAVVLGVLAKLLHTLLVISTTRCPSGTCPGSRPRPIASGAASSAGRGAFPPRQNGSVPHAGSTGDRIPGAKHVQTARF